MSTSFADLFPVARPVIAMAHCPTLPGTPRHERGSSIDGQAREVS